MSDLKREVWVLEHNGDPVACSLECRFRPVNGFTARRYVPAEIEQAGKAHIASLGSSTCAGRLETSIRDLVQRLELLVAEEQELASPRNHLIAALCDAIRLAREEGSRWVNTEQAGKAQPIAARPVVRWFAEQMEMALRRNDHKGGWHEDDQTSLATRVIEEANELLDAVDAAVISDDESLSSAQHYSRAAIAEATDVANMAMMVADHFREGGPSRDQGHDVAAEAGKAQGWHRVPELPLVGQECDLPDSDTTVLISPAPSDELNSDDYRLAQLEFTDDSEGHGKPYWSEPHGVEHSFEDYPFWTLPAPPTKDPTNG